MPKAGASEATERLTKKVFMFNSNLFLGYLLSFSS